MESISSSYIGFFFKLINGILEQKSDYIIKNFKTDPNEALVEKTLQNKENSAILEKIAESFHEWRSSQFVQPLMSTIRSLPKEEMAAMAEALVELTSLRRKIDSIVQTVAGPVDVAFISKSDGFVWLKRKHYFDSEKNHDFFTRRKMLEEYHNAS